MGYYISYSNPKRKVLKNADQKRRITLITIMFLCMFLLLVNTFWEQGMDAITRFFIPGDIKVFEEMLHYTVNAVHDGQSLPDAIQTFYQGKLHEILLTD